MNEQKENLPWVLISIAKVTYAISCEFVLSLSQLEVVTPLPRSPIEIRGVIDFRGQIIELLNIRKMLNLKSSEEEIQEFFALMEARRQDHINWLTTLENSVKNETEFTLTTDPHKCAFGKWYDSYDPKNGNIMFNVAFARFDTPHKAIHEIGIKAGELLKNNNKKGAIELIESTRNTTLKEMMHLFDDLKAAFRESKREIVIVIGDGKDNISVAVDEIVAIEHLTEIDQDLIKNTMTDTEYISGIGKRKNGASVLLLNDDYLLERYIVNKNQITV